MASRIEILNDGGFRSDGRRQYELRDIHIDVSQQGVADGSVILSHGLTEVQVSVFGPREAKLRSQAIHDRANISVEVVSAAFSSSERRRTGRGDKRLLELAANIKSAFEPAIQTSIYPRSQIDIFVTILQQDGSLLQTCINATSVALVNAGIPLLDYVCAVTGGIHSTAPMLDLTALEENDLPNVTLAMMPKTSKLTMVTMETQLHIDRFEEILRLACEAGSVIQCEMKVAVREKTISLVAAMNIAPKLATMGEDEDD